MALWYYDRANHNTITPILSVEQNYHILKPRGKRVPILVSVPHCGIAFPKDIVQDYKPERIDPPDDTDFFVHQVYDFVGEMGITMIHAHYSRWVIDLNRSAENQALYTDGRLITGLTPTTNFLGNAIYKSTALAPNKSEIERRKTLYYTPYYEQINDILTDFKKEFGLAILWDAHSIRQYVPTIQRDPFPAMILGTNDGQSAIERIIQIAKLGLSSGAYELSYNHPFKGGNITRHFGDPKNNIHALQLEMIKTLYMDDTETVYHAERADQLRIVLKNTFELLIRSLGILA